MNAHSMPAATVAVAAILSSLVFASAVSADGEHLRCYQMKDPLNLAASADIASELGIDPACKVSRAKQYCEKADVEVLSAIDKKLGFPIPLLQIKPPPASHRICYKVSCPAPDTDIADTVATDTFGTRTLSKLKPSLLCTPAVAGAYRAPLLVSYRLQVEGASGAPALPAVQFSGGQGLRAIRSVGKHKGDYLPAHSLSAQVETDEAWFVDGTVAGGDTGPWTAWYQQVVTMGDYCSTHTGDECNTAWVASGLGRAATLSAVTDGGIVLATWQLSDVWPAGLTLTDPDAVGVSTGIVRLTLAAAIEQFTFDDNATIRSLFGGTAPAAAVRPGVTDDDTQLTAFFTRYHDLDGMMLRLNGLDVAASSDAPSPPEAEQPLLSSGGGSFVVEIDGASSGRFKEISGLESEIEVIEYKDGDDSITHKRAGKAKYKNIVLKRGFVNDASLLEWYKKVLAGTTDRKSGSIIYLDRAGNEVVRFAITDAFPSRWKAPELNSGSDTHIVEEIEFVVERVERA